MTGRGSGKEGEGGDGGGHSENLLVIAVKVEKNSVYNGIYSLKGR